MFLKHWFLDKINNFRMRRRLVKIEKDRYYQSAGAVIDLLVRWKVDGFYYMPYFKKAAEPAVLSLESLGLCEGEKYDTLKQLMSGSLKYHRKDLDRLLRILAYEIKMPKDGLLVLYTPKPPKIIIW